MKAIIIKADGTAPYVEDITGTLDTFQSLVGGNIEQVPSYDPQIDAKAVVYANEEGLILGLPFNRNMLAIKTMELWQSQIAGNIIVLGRDGVNEADVPQEVIDRVVGSAA